MKIVKYHSFKNMLHFAQSIIALEFQEGVMPYSYSIEQLKDLFVYFKKRGKNEELAFWEEFKNAVAKRDLESGIPLELADHYGNFLLRDDSDEEAYVWLDLLIKNIEITDGEFEDYEY